MAAVKIQDVIEALENQSERLRSFLNRETGEIVMLTDDDTVIGNDPDLDPESLDAEPYVALPSSFDIHEWSIMERFAHSRDARERDPLLDAIHGRGAFRAFKSIIHATPIEEEWYRFRREAFEEIARDWLKDNSIEYES